MKLLLRWTLGLLVLLLLMLLGAAMLAGALVDELPMWSEAIVTVDDQSVTLGGMSTLAWMLALGGMLLAGLIVLVVVPLALLLGVGLPLLLCVGGALLALLLAGVALAAVASPLILLVLLVVWAVRPGRRQRQRLQTPGAGSAGALRGDVADLPSRA